MLRHFPQPNTPGIHRIRDYFIATLTFVCVAISLNLDANGSLEQQNTMGLIAWTFLFGLLFGENKEVRMQVIVAVAFATLGEHFASIYMGGYTYRFGNVPAYVPPGHGMVYLTAVALARSGLFFRTRPKDSGVCYRHVWRLVSLGHQRISGAGRSGWGVAVLRFSDLSVQGPLTDGLPCRLLHYHLAGADRYCCGDLAMGSAGTYLSTNPGKSPERSGCLVLPR